MTRIPEPTPTPSGPAYEGRSLHRADEEVVDQGAVFDVRTLLTRRGMLAVVGLGAGALALAACTPGAQGGSGSEAAGTGGSSGTSSGEIPDETAGPYPGDGSNGPDVLERSGIVRSDIRSSLDGGGAAEGVALTFTLTILDMARDGAPYEGVAVYAWHCDAEGRYSMYSEGVENETYLRGVQVAGADGTVTFSSVFPACYTGRWPHIHFEVYPGLDAITDPDNAISTSQLALPEEAAKAVYALDAYAGSADNMARVTLADDNVFGDDGGALQLATVSGDPTGGYTVSLDVGIDTATEPASGSVPGGGGMQGGGQAGEPPAGRPPAPSGGDS